MTKWGFQRVNLDSKRLPFHSQSWDLLNLLITRFLDAYVCGLPTFDFEVVREQRKKMVVGRGHVYHENAIRFYYLLRLRGVVHWHTADRELTLRNLWMPF